MPNLLKIDTKANIKKKFDWFSILTLKKKALLEESIMKGRRDRI